MAIKFCLYYETPETGDYLQEVIRASQETLVVEAQGLDRLPARVNSGAQVVFLEYPKEAPELDRWIKEHAADPHQPQIYLFFPEISTEGLLKALRLGVKECFTYPIHPEEFQEALKRLPAPLPVPESQEATRVICFLGCKGGVGTTFLTVNLGCLLAQEGGGNVLMVDLDLRYGQMVYFLDVKPQYSLAEVIDNVEHLDASYLQSLMYQYDKNLQFLPAPARLEEAEAVTPERLEAVLRFLCQMKTYSHILVDAGHHLDEISLKALDLAEKVVLVTNQTVPALSNTRKLLEILELLGLSGADLEIWLNAWQKTGELSLEDVSKFLGREVKGVVAADAQEVAASINEGTPLVKTAPTLPICRDLKTLAGHFREAGAPREEQDTRWGWLNFFRRPKKT
jgi:pilus assembly protein CpaE